MLSPIRAWSHDKIRNPIVPSDIQYIPNHEATYRLPCSICSYGPTNYRRVANVDRQV